MPRSKRNRLVSLTKTKKKGKEWKEALVATAHKTLDEYPRVILFGFQNIRNSSLSELRDELKETTRFLLTSNGLLRQALGQDAVHEFRPGLHKLCGYIKGDVGLMCTKLEASQALSALGAFQKADFARAGQKATSDFIVYEGSVTGPDEERLPHTMEPVLRRYGLPTRLNRGEIELMVDHEVCQEGQVLDSNQANILRIFGQKMSCTRLMPRCIWENGAFQVLTDGNSGDGNSSCDDLEEIMTGIEVIP